MSVAQILTDGDWRPANSGDTIPMVDPSDGVAFSEIARGGAKDINRAVASARKAFESHWSSTPGFERGRHIRRLGELVDIHHHELAKLESRDTGKPLKQSKQFDTPPYFAIQFFPAARKNFGGAKTDIKCHALDKHFEPIPGLFAAGEVAGMAGGHINGSAGLEGTMLGPSIFSGRVAGGWAAHEAGHGDGFVGKPNRP